jgi:ribokinase
MLGAVGDDAFGGELLEFLKESGIDIEGVVSRGGTPTGTALIVVDSNGENTIVVVPGANGTVDGDTVSTRHHKKGDVLVAQYEIPRDTVATFFRQGQEVGATCVLNPAPAAATAPDLLRLVDVLVVNETELALLSGASISGESPEEDIVKAIAMLQDSGLSGVAVATLGSRGALAVVGDRMIRIEGHTVDAVDTTGAGDCFVGTLAAELAKGSTIDAALTIANAAAALCVTTPGAGPSMPTRAAVDAFLKSGGSG